MKGVTQMGDFMREFSRQLFGGKKKRSSRSNSFKERRRRNNDRDRAFAREQYNASRDHYRNLKKRR